MQETGSETEIDFSRIKISTIITVNFKRKDIPGKMVVK